MYNLLLFLSQLQIKRDFVTWETLGLKVTHHYDDIYVTVLLSIRGSDTKPECFFSFPIHSVNKWKLPCSFINIESIRITAYNWVLNFTVQICIIRFHGSYRHSWICFFRKPYCWKVLKDRGSIIDVFYFQIDLEQ